MLLRLYNKNNNPKDLEEVIRVLEEGGLIIYPTDTMYAIGCHGLKERAIERICKLKNIDPRKNNLSIICYDLSNISEYAKVDNSTFKLMKRNLPGPFTFILNTGNRLPKIFKNRKEVGIRVPDNNIIREICHILKAPIMTTTLPLKDGEDIEYITTPELIEEKFGIYSENKLELAAKFPDVITVEKAQQEEEIIWEALVPALDEAVEKFVAMRTVEGENLKKDILLKGERIRTLVAEVKERSPLVVVEYQEKLNNRLKDLLGGVDVDPQRIATEVAVFADRGCVDEEVTRLESHLIQLKDILDGGGQVGRKLDFLIQEMNRESNTIASKANDIQIVKATIELKSEIEKIREQIQNLE